ncbi:nucleoside recognition domain-containing protein [Dethiosulfatarculus sandiegensis]|uniref:nucleoside recognition domain-containing protein n=1 Tax=Dethiosulfatarculus sandiegensis TaxID=1429043 RepID=UPI000697A58A|nr:nucleoside recognition domain-containing protein [Dethiosulfatarculus sandiegensis]
METIHPKEKASAPLWKQALKQGLLRTRSLACFLLKVVLPFYVASELLMATGVLTWASAFLEPVMNLFKLPPEAAAALTIGMFASLYAAAAVAAPLGMTPEQVTVLGLILGIAHALPVEGAIVRELVPQKHYQLVCLRLAVGLATGWVAAEILI